MDRCPQCSCPTLDRQHACVACGASLQMTPIRVDGRPVPNPNTAHPDVARRTATTVTVAELLLVAVLCLLVASLSVSVLM